MNMDIYERICNDTSEKIIQEIVDNNKDYDLRMFLTVNCEKRYFAACAKILTRLANEAFIPLLPEVLQCAQDLNWLGTLSIIERVKKLPLEVQRRACSEAHKQAIKINDEEWADNLEAMFGLEMVGLGITGALDESI